MIEHYQFSIAPQSRGYHLITSQVLAAVGPLPEKGLLNLFIQHTSACLTINENADADVRTDFESIFNMIVPEKLPFLEHTLEGPDDMPAHIKASMVGSAVTIPISESRLMLGTWQGIYLCEFRNRAGSRKLVATIYT